MENRLKELQDFDDTKATHIGMENRLKELQDFDDTKTTHIGMENRLKELQDFDDTKAGVKGLVDAKIKKIPRIFIRPPEELMEELLVPNGSHMFQVPIIELEGLENKERRQEIIDEVRQASETWGIFYVMNHGLPSIVMEEMIKGTQRFFEQDVEVKKQFYTRDRNKRVRYNSNYNLFSTKSANWRDSIGCFIRNPDPISPHELPATCREIMLEYAECATSLAENILELLSEAHWLESDNFKSMGCSTWCALGSHYYPACPDPGLTLGAYTHSDPCFLTVLLQDDNSGLQVLHQNHWVDVPPIPGALIVNIGDHLQNVTNDKFKSVKHRVVVSHRGPRVSVACFFRTSEENPSIHKDINELNPLDALRPLTNLK